MNVFTFGSVMGCMGAALLGFFVGPFGCGSVPGKGTAESFEELSTAICAPAAGGFTLEIDNEFFPLPPGRTLELEGDEDNGTIEHVTIEVTNETQVVGGVTTRVVVETTQENGVVVEVARDFFVQASDGSVCYYGEEVDNYEGGVVANHDGSWKAGEGENRPGIIMPAAPRVETRFQQESAPGVGEDVSAIVGVGETVREPAGQFENVVHTLDWNPLEGQTSADGEEKFFAPGIGPIEDDVVELLSVTN
jgi:hypothetical protein